MMHLTSLSVRAADGLSDPVALRELVPGLQVVLGPNGAGKSTLAQALSQLWWPKLDKRHMIIRAQVRLGDAVHAVNHHAGRTHWATGAAPALPPVQLAARYRLSLATMLAVQPSDQELFAWIRTEAMGGQDPWALRKELKSKAPGSLTNRELSDLRQANKNLLQAEAHADQLLKEATQERALVAQAASADGLSKELAALNDRREQLVLQAQARSLALQKEGMPSGVEQAWPEDADKADALVARHDEVVASEQKIAGDLVRLHDLLQDAPGEVPARLVVALREKVQALAEASRKATEAAEAVTAARQTCGKLAKSWRTDGQAPSAEALDALQAWAQKLETAEAEVVAAQGWVVSEEPPAVDGPSAAAVREGLMALGAAQSAPGWLKAGLVASLAGGLGLAAVAGFTGWMLAWLASGLCVGFAAGSWVARGGAGGPGVDHLDAWSAAVAAEQAQQAWQREQRQAGERAKQAERKLKRQRALAAERLAGHGFRVDQAGVRQWLIGKAANRLLAAEDALVQASSELAALEQSRADAMAALASFCGEHGLEAPADVAGAKGLVAAVEVREAEGRKAATRRAEQQGLFGRQAEVRKQLAQLEEDGAAFEARVGCSPSEAGLLAQRIELGERARKLADAIRTVASKLQGIEERLAEAGMAVDHLDEDGIDARVQAIAEVRADADGAFEALGALRERLEAAGHGTRFADALADRDAAQAKLESLQQARLHRWLKASLLDEVLQDADAGRSEQLKVVQRWFTRFTQGRYSLRLGPDRELLGFDEEAGVSLPLRELSDATRVQALLAARVAGVQWAEQGGEALPLCLDEVLSTTDPDRFDEVVGCLCELAGHRQLLYFTSDPAEAARVRDGAARRGVSVPIHALVEDTAVEVVPTLEQPAPQPADPAAWAASLPVPSLSLRHDVGAWHLAHLLPDQPELLAGLVHRGVDTYGRYQALSRVGQGTLASEVLHGRGEMARALVELARVGQGAKVPLADLQASGIVSSSFWDRTVELHQQVEGDGPALLHGICGLKGFRKANKAKLQGMFEEQGWVDPRPALDADRATGQAAAPFVQADAQALHLARRWWQALRKDNA